MSVTENLQTYITAELGDAALYRALAKIAPDEMGRTLLLEFADDEYAHAVTFQKIYHSITGKQYNPVIPPVVLAGTYGEILLDRVLDESGDYRKYGEQYLITKSNLMLKNAYYRASMDENVHASRLLYMISKL